MNRFQRGNGNLIPREKEIVSQKSVRLYDGDERTNFEKGMLILTNYRLLWRDQLQFSNINELCVNLPLIAFAEDQASGWNKSAKIVLHLNAPSDKSHVHTFQSPFNYVKLSFREGGHNEFYKRLNDALNRKEWESLPSAVPKFRPGIMGIERQIQAKNQQTDKSISVAFEDLSKLMEMAKDMVGMAKNISQRIRDKQGDISDDETHLFKSQLLSLGISDPVTKNSHGSGISFFTELSKQLSEVLLTPVEESGGILALTDAYCRINRARGLELLSPEDLVNGCMMFESLGLPLRLQVFETGVKVIQLASQDDEAIASKVQEMLTEKGSLSADELSVLLTTTVVLGKERLLQAERQGIACRDDSLEGLRFYPNLFLTNEV